MIMPHGIPTLYKGIKFRSRGEARWAAMFDLIGWEWEYEPIDLAGYIPDFVITNFRRNTIIEVKPAMDLCELDEHQEKIDRSGWTSEAIIVGAKIWQDQDTLKIGTIREGHPIDGEGSWDECSLTTCSHNNGRSDQAGMDPCGMFTPISWERMWECKLCGLYGKHYYVRTSEFMSAWAQAGNKVQWRRKR